MQIVKTQTDKLVVGSNDVSHPEGKDQSPTGTAVLNGPVYVGKTGASPNYEAVLNITSNSAEQLPGDQQPACSSSLAMKSDGNLTVAGDSKTSHALLISGGSSIDTVRIVGDLHVTGSVDCLSKGRLEDRHKVADGKPPKSFDIEHPTKGKGWRLRYVCLEGPEAAVYCRGRLKESNVINLPDHWKGLVHEDSISVQLQPIGDIHLHLNVVSFDNEKIVIKEADDKSIDCFFHVFGERKDVNPLLTEYEGNDRYDYPDPNFNENSEISVEDRNYTDSNYSFPRNTITS